MSQFGDAAETAVEDLATPIRAWRVWTVRALGDGRGWALASYAMTPGGQIDVPNSGTQCLWSPEGMEARCFCPEMRRAAARPGDPPVPDRHRECPGPPPPQDRLGVGGWGHGCGLYGMRTERDLWNTSWIHYAHVAGEVELGGRIWEHGRGYRARYARVVAVTDALPDFPRKLRPWATRIVQHLQERYCSPEEG